MKGEGNMFYGVGKEKSKMENGTVKEAKGVESRGRSRQRKCNADIGKDELKVRKY